MERQLTVEVTPPPITEHRSQASPQSRASSPISRWALASSSFLFVLLQSVCTAVIAISGLRLLIAVGSLAAASSSLRLLDAIHRDAIRLPMLILAVAGSAINLYVIWRIRSLRQRPSSRWRAAPLTPEKKRAESTQIALAVVTLLLVAAEWLTHIHLFGHA